MPALSVRNLSVVIDTPRGPLTAVDDLSFSIDRGRALGMVGESGSGKTLAALAIPRLVRPPIRIERGTVSLNDQPIDGTTARAARGRNIGFVFQEPMTALNPVMAVGFQVGEALRVVDGLSRASVREKVLGLFGQLGIAAPDERWHAFPHELSGGMRQRVLIAMALARSPSLLIADEPTTALDATLQKQILSLLREQMTARGLALLLISHDLGVVAEVTDDVAVMYLGQIMEQAATPELFARPLHPYTQGLMGAMPGDPTRGKAAGHRRLTTIAGSVPQLSAMPTGCRFRDRCPLAETDCAQRIPLIEAAPAHFVRCIKAGPP